MTKVEPNKSGPNSDDDGPKKTLTEEWYHYNQDDEQNLLIYIPKKFSEEGSPKKALLKIGTTAIRTTSRIC